MFEKFRNSQSNTYIIAEVGQNHQGKVENALKYIKVFKNCGVDAIKFQIRDNKYLFDDSAYNMPYNSDNAFAENYGPHREKLELSKPELSECKNLCDELKIDFIATPFDEPSLEFLISLSPKAIKIASFDLGNLPFISSIAKSNLPIVLSIGGGKDKHIKETIKLIEEFNNDLAILHCVSKYPCPENELNLSNIEDLLSEFPKHAIGSSDHFNGISSGVVAYMLGARVFEKHVTLNRAWKGTDHSFALEPEGMRKFVRDIKRTKDMINENFDENLGQEPVFKKLGKSLIYNKSLKKNSIIKIDDLSGRIFLDQGIPVREAYKIIGKKLDHSVKKFQKVHFKGLK